MCPCLDFGRVGIFSSIGSITSKAALLDNVEDGLFNNLDDLLFNVFKPGDLLYRA
jgi:hypothetical protein